MPPSRIACLFIPSFPLAAHWRIHPERRNDPLAIYEGKAHAAALISVSLPASQLGLSPGLSLPQAKALVPSIELRTRDLEAERACQQALLEVAAAFSPRVEEGSPGLVYLDTHREKAESFLAESLIRRAKKVGLVIHVGVARSKLVTRIAAQQEEECTLVETGQESEFLAALPLSRLGPSPNLLTLLSQWGLATIGAFAQLQERDVLVRLGREGWALHQQARGLDPEPLAPHTPALTFREGLELEWEIGEIEPFLHLAEEILVRLLTRLELASLACRKLTVKLTLEPQGHEVRTLDLPAPTRHREALLGLLRRELEARPLTAPVVGLLFEIQPERPRSTQLSLFGPPALSLDAWSTALARLAALLGPDRMGSPRAVAGTRPEQFALENFVPPSGDRLVLGRGRLPDNRTEKYFAAIRVFRPPIPLRVHAGPPGRGPTEVRSQGSDQRGAIQGTVQGASGPWRVEDGWWTDEAVEREYWDVALSDQSLYRIYHDLARSAWFADGIYD